MKKPYLELRRRIEDEGLDMKDLSELSGVPRSTLNDRINAPEAAGAWRWKEIAAICKVAHIQQDEIGKYFFPAMQKEATA